MEAFENSSLGLQMALMVFFLMIALVYFILIIYGFIWKQKWKLIAANIAVCAVTFFMAACFNVEYLIDDCGRDPIILYEIPYVVFVAAGICTIAYAAIQIIDTVRQRKMNLQANSIQESLDNLPSGVGFFDQQGMPVLINRQMHRVCRQLTGQDVQSVEELREALEHPLKDHAFYDSDFQVYCFADGSVWKFSEDSILTESGERFLQFLASEVSELYQSKLLLEKENRKLQEMSAAMKELSKNIVTLTREEETLAMKMQVHDTFGYSVLETHRMLIQECEENQERFLLQWNRILKLLRKDNEPAEEEMHQRVQERADALGLKLFYTGEMPQDPQVMELLDVILLEAVSNSVCHAGATKLYVKMSSQNGQWKFVITNNGKKPDKEIEEGGGLSAIRKKVEMRNGVVRLHSFPEYSLTILLPQKEGFV